MKYLVIVVVFAILSVSGIVLASSIQPARGDVQESVQGTTIQGNSPNLQPTISGLQLQPAPVN